MASRDVEKKRRKGKHALKRKKPHLNASPTILIVCEGKNTEPSYFNQLKLSSATIEAIGEGYNTTSLVIRAEEIAAKNSYDEVWCVFDKDDFTCQDFNNAIQMAKSKKMHAVYSNQAFEFWLILHFNDHQGNPLHRRYYTKMLNEALQPYDVIYDGDGSKIISPEFFNLLISKDPKTGRNRNELAIERAERICEGFDHRSPALEESSTTVFKLMKHLEGFSRY